MAGFHPPEETVTFRARYVFPIVEPPRENGTVTVRGDHVLAVNETVPGSRLVELGNVAIAPGWVNAHAHLELSDADGPLGHAAMRLADWLPLVVSHRRREGHDPGMAIRLGLNACQAAGVAVAGDIVQPGWSSATCESFPGHVVALHEVIGWTPSRAEGALAAARDFLQSDGDAERWTRGLAPHAPQTVSGEVLDAVVRLAREREAPLAMHLAESPEEMELLRSRAGPLRTYMEGAGLYEPDRILVGRRPLDYLRVLSAAPRALVIHGNHLDANELDFLAARRDTMALVYCSRTHGYFGHRPWPLREALDRGVQVALGTDSLASTPDLSLFREMQHVAARHPDIAPQEILRLGTLGGAQSLGLDSRFGRIVPGASAWLACVELPALEGEPHTLLLHPAARTFPLSRLASRR